MRSSAFVLLALAFLAACGGAGGTTAPPGVRPSPSPSASASASPTALPTLAVTAYQLPSLYDPGSQGRGSIAAGPDGNLWITECPNINSSGYGRVGKMSTSGALTEYGLKGGVARCPSQITTGPDGALWFTENPGPNITQPRPALGRIDTLGNITEYRLPASDRLAGAIALGSDGDLWYDVQAIDRAGDSAIRGFSPITHRVVDNVVIPFPMVPGTLVTNPIDGSLIVGTSVSQGSKPSDILQVVPGTSGSYAVKYIPLSANSGDWSYVALGADGNMYIQFVASPFAGTGGLAQMNEATYSVTLFTETPSAGGPGQSTAFRGPLVYGPDANIYVWDDAPRSLSVGVAALSTTGTLLAQQVDGNNPHDRASGMVIGRDGTVWVAMTNILAPSGTIYRITPVH